MTLTEVIPLIDALPRVDKFELMRFILSKLSKEEDTASIPHGAPAAQKKNALLDIVGMAEGEEDDVARQHDKYLYGAK
ncbi:MAG: hypothetical protein WGN25_01000 [Candidatus Electrothrix sp. GW3-4]|uniref:hypothetical protein n=1 Tax=Candidatus Electrothrix sp. GW3-4 TaxID=3126740 RepID=UPI0030D40986